MIKKLNDLKNDASIRIVRLYNKYTPNLNSIISFFLLLSGILIPDDIFNIFKDLPFFIYGKDVIQHTATYTLIVLAIIQLAINLIEGRSNKKIDELEKKILELEGQILDDANNLEYLIIGYLYSLSRSLDFTENERITAYIYDEGTNEFVPIGRYSPSPIYSKKGRPSYPANEGCISLAWRNGTHHEPSLPGETEDYLAAQEALGISRLTYSVLTMHARFYYGYSVKADPKSPPHAVIVIESTIPEKYSMTKLQRKLTDESKLFLGELLGVAKKKMGTPNIASESGL